MTNGSGETILQPCSESTSNYTDVTAICAARVCELTMMAGGGGGGYECRRKKNEVALWLYLQCNKNEP